MRCRAAPLPRRVIPIPPMTSLSQFRALQTKGLPSFYLLQSDGCNFDKVRAALRGMVGGHWQEERIPITFAQYLVDIPLLAALEAHPRRTLDPTTADWHILAATPFASMVLAAMQGNVSADGHSFCTPGGPCQSSAGGTHDHHGEWKSSGHPFVSHVQRMASLRQCLKVDPWFATRRVPFLLLSPGNDLLGLLGRALVATLRDRNRRLGPVIAAGNDRSAPSGAGFAKELLRRMLVLPYAASPESSLHARLCESGRLPLRWSRPAVTQHPCALVGRHGVIFHGDHGRHDWGTRGAVRDISTHLAMPHMFVGLRLLKAVGNHSSSHAVHRQISQRTTLAMLRTALCWVPRGDTDTSRRLFDALALGCVPIVTKPLFERLPVQALLANLPFQHTHDWRKLAIFIAPGMTSLRQRYELAQGRVLSCRREEAAWLDQQGADHPRTAQLRLNGLAAFRRYMDVEGHPRGTVTAFLRELSYILDDVPASIYLPPPHMRSSGCCNTTGMSWMFTK